MLVRLSTFAVLVLVAGAGMAPPALAMCGGNLLLTCPPRTASAAPTGTAKRRHPPRARKSPAAR